MKISEETQYPVGKNKQYDVKIIDYGANGEGIAKIKGYTIFVDGGIKGEKCKIHILKVLKSHAFAKIIEIYEKSELRVEDDCSTYKKCGGCSLRHIKYEETLNIKRENVQNLANKMLNQKILVKNTIGLENPFYYRNKAIYPVGENEKNKIVGIYAKRSHNIIPFEECKIQTKISQEIAKYIINNWNESIYNENTKKGLLRNIMIREGFNTKEVMVVLIQTSLRNIENNKIKKDCFDINKLLEKFPMVKTIVVNINEEDTNVVLGKENISIYGDGKIKDILNNYTFEISPNSFYQVNPKQTEVMYNLAIQKARLDKNDVLCDLYCGIGTIGIFASKYVKKVYGIEIVNQAIEDAKINAKINKIENIEFIQGDVEEAFEKLLNKKIIPNAVIVDPPRKGLDEQTIKNLIELKLEKLVYISCNPATLMRDLSKLEEVYEIKEITPIDNFCYSNHIECVSILKLK